MTRRTRRISGIFAALALTLSFAETVWASTCAPGMDMPSSAMAMGDESPIEHECMPGSAERRNESEDGRHCPFGPVATTQACAGLASLPANTLALDAPSPEGAARLVFDETQHDLFFGTPLFHPPRS